MKYVMDLKSLCAALRKSDRCPVFADELCEAEGEKYLYENVVQNILFKRPIRICDIDFDAFDEDDIVDLIDNKTEYLEEHFRFTDELVKCFENSSALAVQSRRFF